MSDQNPAQPAAGDEPSQPYPAQPYGQPYGAQPYGAQPVQPYGAQPVQPYGAQPYAQYGYAYPASPPSNQLAVISLILGIVGLVLLPVIASIPAIITGHMARKQIRERGEGGDGMALGGMITGYIGAVGYTLIFLLILLPFVILAAGTASSAG